jgi:hypothetical protein
MAWVFTLSPKDVNNLSSTDLQEELDRYQQEYFDAHGDGVDTDTDLDFGAFDILVRDDADRDDRIRQSYEGLAIEGRVGIAAGGNAEWGDTRGDADAAIWDYLNDADAWAARA